MTLLGVPTVWTWRVLASTVLAVIALADPAPARADNPTWIGIGGPQDWAPSPGYTLEVGRDAWRVDAIHGGGVTTVALNVDTVVRLRRLSDCAPLVRFVAVPGRNYFIRFAANGSARVEDWTGQGMDAGPALGDPGVPVCPALPDTSATVPERANESPSGLPGVALAAGIIALAMALRRPARRRDAGR